MSQSKKLAFIPMYNCEKQIIRVLGQFDNVVCEVFDELLIVDNKSSDQSAQQAICAAKKLANIKVRVIENLENYNLGGSHKVAFNYALDNGFDYIVVLHGDDQGDIRDVMDVLTDDSLCEYDCVLGSRFMRGAKISG